MTNLKDSLSIVMANTYSLYLKTQNYHWHVRGSQFYSLHKLFELQYLDLAEAIDQIAERMIALGYKAPATYKELMHLKTIKDGNSDLSANQMVLELASDNKLLVDDLNNTLIIAQTIKDEGTINLLSDRIAKHQKSHWMLNASHE